MRLLGRYRLQARLLSRAVNKRFLAHESANKVDIPPPPPVSARVSLAIKVVSVVSIAALAYSLTLPPSDHLTVLPPIFGSTAASSQVDNKKSSDNSQQ